MPDEKSGVRDRVSGVRAILAILSSSTCFFVGQFVKRTPLLSNLLLMCSQGIPFVLPASTSLSLSSSTDPDRLSPSCPLDQYIHSSFVQLDSSTCFTLCCWAFLILPFPIVHSLLIVSRECPLYRGRYDADSSVQIRMKIVRNAPFCSKNIDTIISRRDIMDIIIKSRAGLDVHKETVVACIMGT